VKLYSNETGANCRRVAIYLKEKGLSLEIQYMNLSSGELKTPEFRKVNPAGLVPVLELDDGTYIPESTAIIEYLEEIHPKPCLIGQTPVQRARVRAIEMVASDLGVLTIAAAQHSHPMFATRLAQVPAVAAALQKSVDEHMQTLETHLGDKPYLLGSDVTIADIVLFPLFQTCRERLKLPYAEGFPKLLAWYARFSERPSAKY
jgi:glutathione S-transferase